MEAFFIAVALELGTRTGDVGPADLAERMDKGQLTVVALRRELWRQANAELQVAEFMQHHPGAPPVLSKLRRMHLEAAGGLRYVDEQYFWSRLAEAYLEWCRRQSTTG